MFYAPYRRARAGAVGLALLAAVATVGCGASGPIDDTTAPVQLIVGNVTALSIPFGDVITSGGTVPEDTIRVPFTARLKNTGDLSQPALQDVVIERYEVTFSRTDGGKAVPAGFQRGINARVRITPHDATQELITQVDIVLVPSTTKLQPPISHLISPGFEPDTGFINIQVNATVRFFGRTVAGDPVSARATIGINFANFGDNNP